MTPDGVSGFHSSRRAGGPLSRRQWWRTVACSSWSGAASLGALRQKLEPRDEAGRDPDLRRVLNKLAAIVERRREQELLSWIGPDFRVEFSAGQGPSAFRQFWRTDQADSEIWGLLARLLAIGGTFYSPDLFAVPYVYTRFPVDLDPFGHVVALQDSVPVHRDSLPDSPIVSTLRFDIVPAKPALRAPVRLDRMGWAPVVAAGRPGYVSARQVWSPAGHRAFFEKRRGRWAWISLVCAD